MHWPLKREYTIGDLAYDAFHMSDSLGFGIPSGKRLAFLEALGHAYGPALDHFKLLTPEQYLSMLQNVLDRMKWVKESPQTYYQPKK